MLSVADMESNRTNNIGEAVGAPIAARNIINEVSNNDIVPPSSEFDLTDEAMLEIALAMSLVDTRNANDIPQNRNSGNTFDG